MLPSTITLDALGTRWWILVPAPLGKLETELLDTIKQFENSYTRFDDKSFIGQLNIDKHVSDPPPELIQILQYCLEAYQITSGVFNISIGSKLESLGYGNKHDPHAKVSPNLPDDLKISPSRISTAKNTRIDLGGVGKGWLIDNLGRLLADSHDDFIINGGGDILAGPKPQTVFIEHPTNAAMAIGEVTISNSALASSSHHKRIWHDSTGKAHSHIQSPALSNTQQPTAPLLSIHVKAHEAKLADMLATAFMLIDHDQRVDLSHKLGVQFMEVRPDLTYWQSPGFDFRPYT